MNIIVTGDTGFLGPYLKVAFSRIGEVSGASRSVCDLTDAVAVKTLLGARRPEMIVHAAAMTDVEKCSQLPQLAVLHNSAATENLVRNMPKDCRFVYISTDGVYSGTGPHREHSRSENPLNMYGMSKFMGEFAAAKAANHLIVRTNMYGKARSARKSSLVDFLVGKLKEGSEFNVFTDSYFTPLWTQTLAEKLVVMARSKRTGVFNLGASTGMSKSKFAMLLADGLGLDFKGARPVESASLPNRVPRSLDTRMDISKTEASFDFSLPTMESDIKAMCENIKCTN